MHPPGATTKLNRIADECVIQPGVAPAAALGWARRTSSDWTLAVGSGGSPRGGGRRLDPMAPFDLASVTKPFVALVAARLVARGRLEWQAPLARWVPELAESASGDCPIEHFLSHRSGLIPHLELFAPLRNRRVVSRWQALRLAANARREDCRGTRPGAGFPPVYSDLGYLLAGLALERAGEQPLDGLVEDEVCSPLRLDVGSVRQWIGRGATAEGLVPTELVAWRGGDVRGVVHDENAWALAGHGMAGHAGLFGSVTSVLRLGLEVLEARRGRSRWLSDSAVEFLVAERPGGTLRLGFDAKSATGSTAGVRCGPRTFGHLGFTGTSVWCDPDAEVVTALLTNRVRPTRNNMAIRQARPIVHDALFEAAHRDHDGSVVRPNASVSRRPAI
jgi:CubicO group peptidase (beta-lactamase class C family)